MNHEQFKGLIHDKKVHIHDATEKTDGIPHVMGHDEHGFYTQSSISGSEKMRKPEDYHERSKRRAKETGREYNPGPANSFGHIHKIMASNKALTSHLEKQHKKTGQDVKIRGEVYYKPTSVPSTVHKHERQFVATSYDPSHMGEHGKYVIHTKLPENHHLDVEKLKKHSTKEMNFDDDKTDFKKGHVEVSKEHEDFHKLDHELINSRTTPKNKAAKMAELEKMGHIQKRVSDKVDAHVKSLGLKPKWGSGTEGLVVHPHNIHPHAPRFKVTSDTFRQYKADPENKNLWRKR
jgi:hypothetical protein